MSAELFEQIGPLDIWARNLSSQRSQPQNMCDCPELQQMSRFDYQSARCRGRLDEPGERIPAWRPCDRSWRTNYARAS